MINIRRATVCDVESVIRVHHSAVHGTDPSSFYPKDILQSWSPGPNDEQRLEQFRLSLNDNEKVVLVAQLVDNCTIVGFGTVVPSKEEIRALYIDPSFTHRGIGSQLLQNLEQIALLHGTEQLHLDSSLNAEKFYSHHGYSIIQRGTHRLHTGISMQCIKMSKILIQSQSIHHTTQDQKSTQ